jgi:hypothetical protein
MQCSTFQSAGCCLRHGPRRPLTQFTRPAPLAVLPGTTPKFGAHRPGRLAHTLSNVRDWATLLQNVLVVAASHLKASGGRRTQLRASQQRWSLSASSDEVVIASVTQHTQGEATKCGAGAAQALAQNNGRGSTQALLGCGPLLTTAQRLLVPQRPALRAGAREDAGCSRALGGSHHAGIIIGAAFA